MGVHAQWKPSATVKSLATSSNALGRIETQAVVRDSEQVSANTLDNLSHRGRPLCARNFLPSFSAKHILSKTLST